MSNAVGILVLHAAILCFQLIAIRLFPSQRGAIWGSYFILMPVGFNLFLPPGPGISLAIVVFGVVLVLYLAHRGATKKLPESDAADVTRQV